MRLNCGSWKKVRHQVQEKSLQQGCLHAQILLILAFGLLTDTLSFEASGKKGCGDYELLWGLQCLSPALYFPLGPTQTLPNLPKSCGHCWGEILRVLAIVCVSRVPMDTSPWALLTAALSYKDLVCERGLPQWSRQPEGFAVAWVCQQNNLVMCRGRVIVLTLLFSKRKTLRFMFPWPFVGKIFFASCLCCMLCASPAEQKSCFPVLRQVLLWNKEIAQL